MNNFSTFKEWFPHSPFVQAGSFKNTLVSGQAVAIRRGEGKKRAVMVDWGGKFLVTCPLPSMAGLRGRSRRDITDAAAKLEYDRQAELGDIRPGDLVVVL